MDLKCRNICSRGIVVLLVMMFGLQKLTDMPANFAVACAMTIAILVGCFLYQDKLQRESVRFLSSFFYVED